MQKYVTKTDLKDEDGTLHPAGSVVDLGKDLAEKFNKAGLLEIYIPDDEPAKPAMAPVAKNTITSDKL